MLSSLQPEAAQRDVPRMSRAIARNPEYGDEKSDTRGKGLFNIEVGGRSQL